MKTAANRQPLISTRVQNLILVGVVLVAAIAVFQMIGVYRSLRENDDSGAAAAPHRAIGKRWKLSEIPFDGQQAYDYLKQLCDLGPRPCGSQAMARQQQLLIEHFQKLGATVEVQRATFPHPRDHSPVPLGNLIVHWHPDREERILLCSHYDTRPFPDRDPKHPQGRFIGANDGASGTALLMQLAKDMPKLDGKLGVDFVLFDAEEFVFADQDPYFVGAEFFAREYVQNPPPYKYRWGVLLDMVGDADLQLYEETNSIRWRDTAPLVAEIWGVAKRLGIGEFIPQTNELWNVRDDHLKLHDVAHIPTCDIIDMDYDHWHTEADTPRNCSPLSLAKVGWVVHQWLQSAVRN